MENTLIIVGNSNKGTTYEEEKRYFDFYCDYKPGEEFHFENLIVAEGNEGCLSILKHPILRAPDERNTFFVLLSEPYTNGLVIKNPCNIPKFIVPFEDIEATMLRALEVIRISQR